MRRIELSKVVTNIGQRHGPISRNSDTVSVSRCTLRDRHLCLRGILMRTIAVSIEVAASCRGFTPAMSLRSSNCGIVWEQILCCSAVRDRALMLVEVRIDAYRCVRVDDGPGRFDMRIRTRLAAADGRTETSSRQHSGDSSWVAAAGPFS